MPGRLEFDLSLSAQPAAGIPNRGAAGGVRRLLLMGDFSGLPAAQRVPLATRPTWRVDMDNLDARLGALRAGVQLGTARLAFHTLDDFHPDSLLDRLPGPAAWPAGDGAAAPQSPQAGPASADAPVRPATDDAGQAELLARLLGGGGAGAAASAAAPAPAGLDAFLRQLVAPHVVRDDPAARAAAEATDNAAARRLRALLHAPGFQALEANWRGLHWLVSQLELDEQLQLHLFDVQREELLDDLVAAGGQVAQTGLFQALVQRGRDQPGNPGWSALVGLWAFGPSVQHIGLLAALGLLAAQAGAPLVAGADLALGGDDVQALAGWQALRRSDVAPWIGLAAPGVLLRQPYGPRSDPVQALDFEEFGGGAPDVARCLWGPAALVPALLLARGEAGAAADVAGLPAVTWRQDGESQLLPVAWPALDEAAAQRLQQAGLMPLWAHRQQALLRLACWQSVALDGRPLAA